MDGACYVFFLFFFTFLPAFTRPGHECQGLLSPCDECMCAQTRPRFIYSSGRFFFGMESKPILKNPLYRRRRGGSHPRRCITQNSTPNTLPTELFRPPDQESNPKPPVLETNAFPTEPSSRCLGSTARRRCAGDQHLPHRAIQPVPWSHGPSSLCTDPSSRGGSRHRQAVTTAETVRDVVRGRSVGGGD